MIDRDDFITYLLLMGFEEQKNKVPQQSNEYAYRMAYEGFQPIIINCVVYQKKTHLTTRLLTGRAAKIMGSRGSYRTKRIDLVSSTMKRSTNGHHGEAMRWLKDNFGSVIKEAEEHGARRL